MSAQAVREALRAQGVPFEERLEQIETQSEEDGTFGVRLRDLRTAEVFESRGHRSKKLARQAAFDQCWQRWAAQAPPPIAAPAAESCRLRERGYALVVGTPLLAHGRCVSLRSLRERSGTWTTSDPLSGAEGEYAAEQLAPFAFPSKLAESVYAMLSWRLWEQGHSLRPHLLAHHMELPLLYLACYKEVRKHLPQGLAPHARLARLQAAVRDAPGLALRRDGTCVTREPLRAAAPPLLAAELRAGIPAVRLAADGPPARLSLPARVDYLHSLQELLGGALVPHMIAPPRSSERRVRQPVLYARLDHPAAPHNAIASALCGFAVCGDAVLCAADFLEDGEQHPSLPQAEGEDCSMLVVREHGLEEMGRQIARQSGVGGYVAYKQERVHLSSWGVPRPEAWPAAVSPKQVLDQYAQEHAAEVRVGAELAEPGNQQSGFVGRSVLVKRSGEEREDRTMVKARKKDVRKADGLGAAGMVAEACAAVLALQAIHEDEASPEPPLLTICHFEGAAAEIMNGEEVAADGSKVTCSYKLTLLPPDGAEGEGGVVLEEKEADEILLGGAVVQPAVEELFRHLCGGARGGGLPPPLVARAAARYYGAACVCVIELAVLAVEEPQEERYELSATGGEGLVSHGDERLAFVERLASEAAASDGLTSLADVGCGEGKLLARLARLPLFTRLVGIDASPSARPLAKAAAKIRAAAPAEGPVPRASLYCGSLRSLDQAPRCEVITLVEVVEHLDSPELEAVGPALFGRCAPRRVIVTTPNKEFNLNWMVPPAIDPDTGKPFTAPPIPPPVRLYALRNRDHRFEWTRAEFKAWAGAIASRFGYTVEFRGIGGGAMDEHSRPCPHPWPASPKAGDWHGPGPQTQVAIFDRKEGATHLEDASELADGPPLRLVWSSEPET
ncbi:hypothetical protein AB1Y20_017433 [Prymnesium parvum]|uniref:Small RNA 2'-O-methyltransferase n=1 Tax=Prymnesium parvum TaxID=97485 RepID=A0AB34JN60_PRYPA